MSFVTLVEQPATPVVPPTGKARIYINAAGTVSSVDDAGVVTTYGAGITPEEVQDIVGAMMVDSSTIDVTYNDPANTISMAVIPAGVDHNSLANLTTGNPHTQYLQTSVAATTYQPLDGDLTAVAGLAGTGIVTRTAANTMTTRTLTAGTGVSVSNGDGVSGNPTVALSNVGTAGTYGSASAVPVLTTNAQGQVSSVTNTTIAIPSTAVTDFAEAVDDRVAALVVAGTGITATYNDPANTLTLATTITQYTDEQAQDAVGTILTDTASVDFTYNDAGNQISAAVLPAGVNHDALLNFVANAHINHSAVSLVNGTGISATGLGDLTASRTINIANTGVTAASYGSATQIPILAINPQGQVTSASTAAVVSSQWVDSGGFLTWSNQSGDNLQVRQASNVGESAYIEQVTSRGTLASPAASQSGDRLGGNGYLGWSAAGKSLAYAGIEGFASQNFTNTAQGTELRIFTIPNGTTTQAERIRIGNDGLIDIQTNRITNAADPINPQDYATKAYVDAGNAWQDLINTATLTNSSNSTTTEVTNLRINVVSGRNYRIEAHIRFRSAAAATGIAFTMNSSDAATGSIAGSVDIPIAGDGTAAIYSGSITSLGDLVIGSAVPAAATDYLAVLVAQFTCTATGTIAPFFRSENNGTTVTVQIGSNIIAREWA